MKKKLLTLGLSSTLALSSIVPAFAGAIAPNTDKTYIETAIGFRYAETVENLKGKNLKATLNGGSQNLQININDFLNNDVSTKNINGYTVDSLVEKENGKVTTIKFKISGLPAATYNLTLEGKNYVKTVTNLDTTTYSKRVNISTATNMVLGDVNQDGKVNSSDRKLLEDNLNATNSNYDLNNDGKITVADISIVNSSMSTTDAPEVFDTEMVASKIVSNIKTENVAVENGTLKGDIKNLFTEGQKVEITAKNGQNNVSLPLEFNTPQEMSSVEVTIPSGAKDAEILVYDEQNNPIPVTKNMVAGYSTDGKTARNGEKIVTINLGNRVPVKKIVVSVTPTEDGGTVVVDEVKFLKDVVNENIVQDNFVKHLKAYAGDSEVKLSWGSVNNAIGYKIYYGTDEDNLEKSMTVDVANATVSDLENLKTYYFSVSAIFKGVDNKGFEGPKSNTVSAIPQPEKPPVRPDFVKATSGDTTVTLSWKEAENAKTYNIYAKTSKDSSYKKVASNISSTRYTITGLENNVEYTLYVTSQNNLGESSPSELVNATPRKEDIKAPTFPTLNRISNDNVESIVLSGKGNDYDKKLYPNGFDTKWLIDNDFNTTWVAEDWGSRGQENSFTFTFKQPKTMDYLVWAPRLDGTYKNGQYIENAYRRSFTAYDITVWTTDDDINGPGRQIAKRRPITNHNEDQSYFVFDFPKQENVKKIKVKPIQWDGSFTNMNASEVAFYEYNDIADRIANLFSNSSRTELKPSVTEDEINKLKQEVNSTEGFILDKNILSKELDIATSLLKKNTENLGVIKDNIYSIDTSKDVKSINSWQPLGVVGRANEKVVIYADIPEGETVQLVPTQFFEEADSLTAAPITLKNGRNVITIPKIGQNNYDRGGSLYVTYSGNKADQIKLQVVGGYKIPYLELSDFHTLPEEKAKEKIGKFIDDLEAYNPHSLPGNKEIQNLNQSEIALPNVLLSLPATKVLDGINQNASTREAKIDKLYKNFQAWEELMGVVYKTYGLDDHTGEGKLKSRHNIRYMKMFGGAFMYASGNHIGIQYGSVAPLMNGTPVDEQTKNGESNNLFGWGIAHEIGHVMDNLGKAEVTNNIYSLMAQTYDGNNNTLKSRLELNNVYDKVFKKVSAGGEGVPNDVFTHLAMYWQLHLAYDGAKGEAQDPFFFYNKLQKDNRDKNLRDMNEFAVAASKVVNKDLTDFFTRWGVSLSSEAKSQMQSLPKEERAIYYLTDESRRVRLANEYNKQDITVTGTLALQDETSEGETDKSKAKEVVITINQTSSVEDKYIQGYEILRKGAGDSEYKSIGFTTSNTYTDYIGSANNMTFDYAVKPVDILGNYSQQVNLGQIRISYDNTIEKSAYNIDEATGVVTFNSPTTITGVKITPKGSESAPTTGKFTVYGNIVNGASPMSTDQSETLIKEINFAQGNYASDPSKAYLTYFNKPGTANDKIWAYDVNSLRLDGFDFNKYNIEFLSYPGDNIEFMEMGIGRLSAEYKYGEGADDVIPKDSLVIVGKYRGNSVLSNIYINGKYPKSNSLNETVTEETSLVPGYTLMFDTLDEDGTITSSTAEGIFIFVPTLQNDNLDGESLDEQLSQLPTEIMAEMYRGSFNEDGSFTKQYKTSDTTWINMPTDESLPTIVLQGNQENLKVKFD